MITEESRKCKRTQYAEMIGKDVRGASGIGEGLYTVSGGGPRKDRGWGMGGEANS